MLAGLRVPNYRRLFLHGQPKQRLCQIRMNPGSSFLPFRSTLQHISHACENSRSAKASASPLHLFQPQHFVWVHAEFLADLFVCPAVLAGANVTSLRRKLHLMCPCAILCLTVEVRRSSMLLSSLDYGQHPPLLFPYLSVHLRHLPPMKTVYYDMLLAVSGHHNGHGETVLADRQLEQPHFGGSDLVRIIIVPPDVVHRIELRLSHTGCGISLWPRNQKRDDMVVHGNAPVQIAFFLALSAHSSSARSPSISTFKFLLKRTKRSLFSGQGQSRIAVIQLLPVQSVVVRCVAPFSRAPRQCTQH